MKWAFFLWLVFAAFSCDALCVEPIAQSDLQVCEDLAKSLGIPEVNPDPPEEGPPMRLPPGTPEFHCGESEGFHPPANGWECTDLVDNDCDGELDSFDMDCFENVCSPHIGSRCLHLDVCDFDLAKCLPPPPPPAHINCVFGWHELCAMCPPANVGQVCLVLNGVAQLFGDIDGDSIPDDDDNCRWYNLENEPCPEGDVDTDGDFVPDSTDTCPHIFNTGDLEGQLCFGHPEADCSTPVISGVVATLGHDVLGAPAPWCQYSFREGLDARFCGLGWTLPHEEWSFEDNCQNCGGLLVEGTMCVLQNGWFASVFVDTDGDSVPDEYPQGFPRDNCQNIFNPSQSDTDSNGIGDDCEEVFFLDQGVSPELPVDAGLPD